MIYVMDYDRENVIARCDNYASAYEIASEYEEEEGVPASILSEDEYWNS